MPKLRKKNDLDLLLCGSLGLELAVALGLGAWLGIKLDSWLSTTPLLLVIGCALGLSAGMLRIVRTVSRLQASGPLREQPDDRGPDQRAGRPAGQPGSERPEQSADKP